METKPIYRDGEETILVAHFEIGGRRFKLVHPGLDIWLDWKAKRITLEHDGKKARTIMDHKSVLKLFLENCVTCESEPEFKLTIGNMHIRNEEEWSLVSSTFLTGEYDEKPGGSDDGSGGSNTVGPVAENEVAGNSRGRGKKR